MTPTPFSRRLVAVLMATALVAPAARAHDLWVNAHAATSGTQSVVVTSIGWGHDPLPLAEFLPGARLSAYALVAPDGTRLDLPFDPAVNASVDHTIEGFEGVSRLQAGDALVRRIMLDDGAAAGGWRVHAANPPAVRTTWVNTAGQTVAAARFVDEIDDAAEIVATAVSVRDATAWTTHGAWSDPQPIGASLEILPLVDPAALRPGDTLPVEVFLKGERLEAGQMVLFGGFGARNAEPDILEQGVGRADFTLPKPGTWILRATLELPVAEAGPEFAEFEGRVEIIRFIATLALEVPVAAEPS